MSNNMKSKRIIDYALKSHILIHYNKQLKEINESKKFHYSLYLFNAYGEINYSLLNYSDSLNNIKDYFNSIGKSELYHECEKIVKATNNRTTRLRKRIKNMILNNDCVFLSLTFSEETLENTTSEERRLLVVRYLKSQSSVYVANIDFGKKNEREHYHALVANTSLNYKLWHKYGAIKGLKTANKRNCDITKLTRYINKLTNHAIKETCKRNHLIYSRNV